ncbi:hypothetical protein RHMOL_Rhmol05G0000600 [Rhododendron molle]|uniref:Uncharacterized protein n=1 Tax=Rhododendron molle TaxID=49168 RepID=A0ACC0NJ69_RHOML|nr:hypothetical protein RHMOL_Rhmol05G0000600 [Rhododendron molle]
MVHVSPVTSDSHQSPARVLYTYDSAADGFSTVLSEDEMETVKKLPGFLSAYGDKQVTVDTTHCQLTVTSDGGHHPHVRVPVA